MKSEIDDRGYSIYDPARAYDWVPKIIRDKRKREQGKKLLEEVKSEIGPMLERIIKKYDVELTPRKLHHFISCLLEQLGRHYL